MQQIRFTTEFVMSKDEANKHIQDKIDRWQHYSLAYKVGKR